MVFIDKNIFFYILNKVHSDRIFPMEVSEFKISNWIESYDEKTSENYWNFYVVEKLRVSRLSKISIPNCTSTNWRLEWRLCRNFRYLSYLLSEK